MTSVGSSFGFPKTFSALHLCMSKGPTSQQQSSFCAAMFPLWLLQMQGTVPGTSTFEQPWHFCSDSWIIQISGQSMVLVTVQWAAKCVYYCSIGGARYIYTCKYIYIHNMFILWWNKPHKSSLVRITTNTSKWVNEPTSWHGIWNDDVSKCETLQEIHVHLPCWLTYHP